jgi:hypothetical protein
VRRALVLYVAVVLLSIGGFEVIRHVGNTLVAPHHVAGAWRLSVPVSSSSCPLLEFKEGEPQSLQVEQSGRYLTLIFSDVHRTHLRVRFDEGTLRGHDGSSLPCAEGKQIHARGHLTGDHLEITLTRSQKSFVPPLPALVLIATRESSSSQPSKPSSSH